VSPLQYRMEGPVTQFTNCQLLRDHTLQAEDLWVQDGKIINPGPLFFGSRRAADRWVVNCINWRSSVQH